MKTLPNGLVVFNATPRIVRFWDESWIESVEVETDEVVDASAREVQVTVASPVSAGVKDVDVEFVTTRFVASEDGCDVIDHAFFCGADVVVGNIITAQAYPGLIVATVPVSDCERMPPAAMRPDKFIVFERR